jgi:YggT family protein
MLTEPVLAPIRKLIPPIGGLDFSPMILLVLLRVLRGML